MDLRKDLKLKYLTGLYVYMSSDNESEDNTFSLINEIKSSRRSKKKWSAEDFVFTKELADKLFRLNSDDVISKLLSEGFISENNECSVYSITNKGLLLFFTF